MNKIIIISAAVLFMNACSGDKGRGQSLSAASYYVDATLGLDSNDGSETKPWKTLARISNGSFSSGTTVYLKKGEIWHEQIFVPADGLTIDSYGTGSLPVIDGSEDISSGSWTSVGSSIYSKSFTLTDYTEDGLGNITENGAMMSFVAWETDAVTSLGSAPMGSYTFSFALSGTQVLQTLYIKRASSPSGNTYRSSVRLYGIKADHRSNITVRNIKVTRFSSNGISFQHCTNCSVYDSEVSYGGGAVAALNPAAAIGEDYLYAGNGIEYDTWTTGGIVDGVIINQMFDSGISPQTFHSGETVANNTYRNSTISNCGFAGIEISVLSNGGTTGSSISSVSVSGVTISDCGKGWSGRRYGSEGYGIRIQADSGAGTISGVRIENTTVTGSIADGIKILGETGIVVIDKTKVYGNSQCGINAGAATETGIKLELTRSLIYKNGSYGLSLNAPNGAGINLYHNTFSENTAINVAIWGQNGTAILRNNLFYGIMTHLYVDGTLINPTVNNNCYHTGGNIIGYNGSAYASHTAFNSATGFEPNGASGTVGLTNPSSNNFTLTPTSIARNIGVTGLGIATDYPGNSYATPPSAGAYEYIP